MIQKSEEKKKQYTPIEANCVGGRRKSFWKGEKPERVRGA